MRVALTMAKAHISSVGGHIKPGERFKSRGRLPG